jgi:CRISPR-associated protein Cas2
MRHGWLIAYDIADPRRLVRIHRFLKEQSLPLQYSVFLASLSDAAVDRVIAGLAKRIDPRADDVRAYRLAPDNAIETIGRPWIADGVSAFLGVEPEIADEE